MNRNEKFEGDKNLQKNKELFSGKTEEYFDRIKNGSETIENILQGVTVDGAIYNSIKQKFYEVVPSSCRDNKNKPLPFPILEEFLTQGTLSVNEDENIKNQRIRTAILYFSEYEWEKAEQQIDRESQEKEQIEKIREEIGVPEDSFKEDVIHHDILQEKSEEFIGQEILLERTISLPEMERKHDQEAIGDLNGSYLGFVEHLLNRDLVYSENGGLVWKGDNKKVVFVGDILGDRTPEGLKIYESLLKLKEQAQIKSGDVSWLSGNHENMFNAVLTGFSTEFGVSVEIDMQKRLNQYSGNLELASFLPEKERTFIIYEVINKKDSILNDLQETIKRKEKTLRIMQSPDGSFNKNDINQWINTIESLKKKYIFFENINDSTSIEEVLSVSEFLPKTVQNLIGVKILENRTQIKESLKSSNQKILESIKQQKLILMYDDTLYVHTNLTKDMAEIIFKNTNSNGSIGEAIKNINAFYTHCLSAYVDDRQDELSSAQIDNFNKIRDIFISTSSQSRINFSEDSSLSGEQKREIKEKLKTLGVNLVIHGHNDEEGKPLGDSDLPIVSIDRSAYKSDNPKNFYPTSAGVVSKNNTFSYY